MLRFRGLVLMLALVGVLSAHQEPTTRVALDVASDRVAMRLYLPLSELEQAFGHEVTVNPRGTIGAWGAPLRAYLTEHIQPVSPDGRAWRVDVGEMSVGEESLEGGGAYQEVMAQAVLRPPVGENPREFVLHYDAILHQVVTHKALVSVHSDWSGGKVEPTEVGVIVVNLTTGTIEPLVVHLGSGSWWLGFQAMLRLGMQHIREGTDHLLFLLVLLLPATLLVRGRGWGEFGGTRYSLIRLLKIVSSFTLGHSVTLLAGALHWLTLPQQPVEVLIAVSILVTAIHAIRPIFPGHEAQIAAGFGLVHGLAFATVLADLNLPPGPMALSIFGFNLGIEFMQLFVVGITVPWLILLSMTPAHRLVRVVGAILAGIASVGWIANRVSGQTNVVERVMNEVTAWAPWGIVGLAVVAMVAYGVTLRKSPRPGVASS